MRFDQLILKVPGDELELRFHAQLTVLSGLGASERNALVGSILGALAGGADTTTLRYLDGTGQAVVLAGRDGQVRASLSDGTLVPAPIGTIATDLASLRATMVIEADDLGVARRVRRDDEPPELSEARDTLEELTEALDAALRQQESQVELKGELEVLEADMGAARDGAARRRYAGLLAQLERVRAEAAALQTDAEGIEADRKVLANADAVRDLAARWTTAAATVAELEAAAPGPERLDGADRERLAAMPASPPADLPALIAALHAAGHHRATIDQRLQDLAVAKLPAPSDPVVAELGLLDQPTLWRTADRLIAADEALRQVQLSLGGLELDDLGPPPALVAEIEAAHRTVEHAESAEERAKVPAIGAATAGLALAALGLATAPVLAPVGVLGAVAAATIGLVRPKARRVRAVRQERQALGRADATSYLGFHIRRVEASIDPQLRELVEATMLEHNDALSAWADLVGPDLPVGTAVGLASEVRAYSEAVAELGDTAEEMEHLRRELVERAEPEWAGARTALAAACRPYGIADEHLTDPELATYVARQCRRGARARAEAQLHHAATDARTLEDRLGDVLGRLGFGDGELDARLGALEWAVDRAGEREDARRRARPQAEVDAELRTLEQAASELRQPEWDEVTAAEASNPDLAELEARHAEVTALLAAAGGEVDIARLADRKAAIERRVTALEVRLGGPDTSGDPGAIADMQQHLLAHITQAGHAGPQGDPVPVILDEAFLRVPADRKWDLLDLLLRLADKHQMVYLTDDAFVAAWARQRALDGAITLLEPVPEPA